MVSLNAGPKPSDADGRHRGDSASRRLDGQSRHPPLGQGDRPLSRQRPLDHVRAASSEAAGASSGSRTTTRSCSSTTRPSPSPPGHRPCAECRRESYDAYRAAWADGLGVELPSAKQMNQQLHGERIVRGTHRRRLHEMPWAGAPRRRLRAARRRPAVVVGDHLSRVDARRVWRAAGRGRPGGTANVITPPSTVAALRAGYPVQIDGRARV